MRHNHMSRMLCISLMALALLAGCGGADYGVVSPASSPSPQTPTSVASTAIPTPYTPVIATGVPTYVYYAQVVEATAIAIAQTLPTPSPIAGLHPDLQESAKRRYIVDIALQTAVALYPPPPNYDPRSEITPHVPLTPFPTEAPWPKTLTQNGAIYNRSLEDDPTGRLLNSQNYWMGNVASEGTSVFAGSEKTGPDHGVIVVKWSLLEGGERVWRIVEYQAPAEVGALRIITEVDGQLTLQAADNSLLYFNLVTRQWVSPTLTPAAATPTLTGPELDATKMARYYEERRQVDAVATSFALGTPYPTLPPRPARTPLPMRTAQLGLHGECADANRYFDYARCWTGLVGNEYVFVSAGATDGQQVQGAIIVYTRTLDLLTLGERITYPAPTQVGKLTIVDVAWPSMTLATMPDAPERLVFTFDLATRQWVSPPSTTTPGPSPSAFVSPVPSVSPLPTQLP
jgi:hypothetical protein